MSTLKKSKSLLIAGSAIAVFSMAACGGSSSGTGDDGKPTAEAVPSMTTVAADPVEGKNAESVCVRNAGGKSGVAVKVSDKLEKAGFKVTDFRNLHTSAIVETSVLYAPNQEEQAKKIAETIGGGAKAVPRPRSFNPCDGAIVAVLL